MKENITLFVGIVAGILNAIQFIPQVVKVIKTKSTKDISIETFIISITAMILRLAYGVLRQDPVIMMFNVFTITFATVILFYKIKYR
ncbi:MAG: SemiSWEET family transporter [Candidatus Gracilibacteria bacterium]|nr:SemiSWEET family transporter [Candidatus Gracilibacteria bacterium]MDD4530674.1 SemiSWEET family transporter [Candidatus Gracilibacteria bacterium]